MNKFLSGRIAAFMKQTSLIFAMLGLFLVAGLATMSVPVMAETPDGETPANEGVCDVLKTNATPGLYGLCVAYCEAQDLDTFEKEPVNSKILANYNKKKQASDPDMPCVKVPCPCWTDAELASITEDNKATICVRTVSSITNKIQIIDNTPSTRFAEADIAATRERCRYINRNITPSVLRSSNITASEALSCYAAVSTACSALGL